MINTWAFSFIHCHRAYKAPNEAGRASKPTPSIGYAIPLKSASGFRLKSELSTWSIY